MAVGDLQFAFNPAAGETPQTIAAKRALALAIMGNTSHAPRDIGEGLNSIGQAIMYRNLMKGVNTAETEGQSGAAKIMQSIFGGGADNQFPPAPTSSPPTVDLPTQRVSQAAGDAAGPANDYFSAIRQAESGGNDNAKAPTSSATGRYQFTGGTWSDMMQKHPELGLTSDGRLDPNQQERAIRAFTADNAQILGNAGIQPTGGNLYAAHFLGAGGATGVLTKPDNTPMSAAVGADVIRANPFLARMNVGQFKQWAASKGGGNSPVDLGGGESVASAAPAPVQTASLDPSAGMASIAQTSRPLPPEFATKGITQEQWDAMNAPDGAPQAPAQAAPTPAPVPDVMAAAQQAVSPSAMAPLPDAQFNARFGSQVPASLGQPYSPPAMPMPYAAVQDQLSGQPVDAKAAIARAMSGQGQSFPPEFGPQDIAAMNARPKPADAVPFKGPAELDAQSVGAPGGPASVTPAGKRVLAAMMQQQPMSGGNAPLPLQGASQASNSAPAGLPPSAPMGTIAKGADGQVYQYAETTGMAGASGPAGWIRRNGAEPSAAMGQAAPPLPSPTTVQDRPIAANNGPDASTLPVIAGGTADVVQPGSGRSGPTAQQLIEAAGNPWVMQRYGPIVDAMISQQMTPHKLDMVPLGNGVIAQVDSVTGRIVGQLKGQPDLKTLKDAAGNEYLVNPADPSHPISVDSIAAGAGGQGQTANGQPDPYASPFPRTMPRTDDMKGYEAYLAQARASGTPADQIKPFQQYQLDLRKMGQPTVNIEGETEYAKGLGKAMADKTNAIIDAGQQAPNKLATYQLMKEMLPNIYTGAGGDQVLQARRAAKSLGIDVGDVSDAEFMQAMGNQMSLELRNPAGGAGMPGSLSDSDRNFLASMSPGLSKTPEGNQKLLDYRMAIEKRNIDVAQRANDYMNTHNGRLDNNFFADLAKWSAANPLFNKSDETKAAPGGKKPTVIDGYTIEEVQ